MVEPAREKTEGGDRRRRQRDKARREKKKSVTEINSDGEKEREASVKAGIYV